MTQRELFDLLKEYFSEHELAVELGRNARTLKRWRDARTGPPVTFIGRVPYYRIASVRQWLQAGESRMSRRRKK
jgi:hypothetical protein